MKKINDNFEQDLKEIMKIYYNLNVDRRNFMLTAHINKKTYEDFYKDKIAEIISLYRNKMNLWLADLFNVIKINDDVKENLSKTILKNN